MYRYDGQEEVKAIKKIAKGRETEIRSAVEIGSQRISTPPKN
jgi:hypothetical protein